jgi:predicted aldo/keto reductase-like oxidoreductase
MLRRDLLKTLPLLGLLTLLTRRVLGGAEAPIPRRPLGRTGERVSIVGIGGAHLSEPKEDKEAVRIVQAALDAGVNFLDNAWDYHHGKSERRVGKALAGGYRDKAFVMTKIPAHTRALAEKQIDESLERLRTDRIDLLQFHEVIRMADAEKILGEGGSLEAVLAAQRAGKVRFIGFTGHKSPAIHKHMLEAAFARGFRFDTVQMPLNLLDAHHDSFEKIVLPILVEHEIGVIGMKPLLGEGQIMKLANVTAIEALHYAMSLPTSVVLTGCDKMSILAQALEAARTFQPFDPARRAALLAKSAAAAKSGKEELYKSSDHFDGTTQHPEWLG